MYSGFVSTGSYGLLPNRLTAGAAFVGAPKVGPLYSGLESADGSETTGFPPNNVVDELTAKNAGALS